MIFTWCEVKVGIQIFELGTQLLERWLEIWISLLNCLGAFQSPFRVHYRFSGLLSLVHPSRFFFSLFLAVLNTTDLLEVFHQILSSTSLTCVKIWPATPVSLLFPWSPYNQLLEGRDLYSHIKLVGTLTGFMSNL